MGIQGLTTIIKKECPNVIQVNSLHDFKGMVIPVDTPSIIYRYKVTAPESWIRNFLCYVAKLRSFNIHPVFVMEGTAPAEKDKTKEVRMNDAAKRLDRITLMENAVAEYRDTGSMPDYLKQIAEKSRDPMVKLQLKLGVVNCDYFVKRLETLKNQNCFITAQDVVQLTNVFDTLGIPYINAPNEAEVYCCQLGFPYVISTDSDILAHGCSMIRSINVSSGDIEVIEIDDLLKNLELNYEEFLDLCITCKTDYNDKIPGVGPIGAHKLIEKYRRIENYPSKYDTSILNFEHTRTMFKLPLVGIGDHVENGGVWDTVTESMLYDISENHGIRGAMNMKFNYTETIELV